MLGVATDEQLQALMRQCVHCAHDLEHVAARRGTRATWRCEWCGRSGDYEMIGTVTARIELQAGDVRRRKPWVPAERVRQAERGGR